MRVISTDDEGKIKEYFFQITPEMFAELAYVQSLANKYREAQSQHQRWALIRMAYEYLTPIIMERAEKDRYLGMTQPYFLPWGETFTPIEYQAWWSIRMRGIGLFHQYPVLNYFLDFGNPYLKIGLELDGRDFHNAEKDLKRDNRLLEQGWRIFRIAGSECYRTPLNLEDIERDDPDYWDMVRDWFINTSAGVIEALSIRYFNEQAQHERHHDFAAVSLSLHRLAQFDL
jgi:hypothetical protein